MTDAEVESFVADGFVRVPGAVPRATVEECRAQLWEATGCSPTDPGSWTEPVVRIGGLDTPAFREAANTPALHAAYDQLAGAGRWRAPLGLGTFPIRFPSEKAPGDDGWHLDAGWAAETGEYRVSLRSRGRALLMLFLFSDVGPDDAPTRIRVGSHLDVPPLLATAGEEGGAWFPLCAQAAAASAGRREVAATGRAGDVFLCHPFLIHAAQRHGGSTPRFLAQPPLEPMGLLDLDSPAPSPVERAVLAGLRRPDGRDSSLSVRHTPARQP
ncbi:phytanoyl-CoA dioxygenase family protein [Streptantibioticus rubrisoli]|uniref:phytanoyl-CoA dioxygenase family protein n=1 Tax=Streptantibioticus rubrisoli TaxID=1387313 RepID=UPI0026E5707F